MTIITDEIKDLFHRTLLMMGGSVLEVELDEDTMCANLEYAVNLYAEKVYNILLIQPQWHNLVGKNLSNVDLAYALSVRTLDMSKDFSFWFSKDAGLQQRGPWELKKDFFTIEKGKQVYTIPAGREINRVMWVNPPTTQAAIYANYGGAWGLGMGMGGYGMAGGSYGYGAGFYIAQSMDIAYLATDLQYKRRLLNGDLTYKVTAGPEGTHLVHLMSTPGSKLTFGNTMNGFMSMVGCEVWYTYYDVTAGDADECRRLNPDVILTPDQIPLRKMQYDLLNEPTKITVSKLFLAQCYRTLSMIRGKYSGTISISEATAQLDYRMLLEQGEKIENDTLSELKERLDAMSPANILKQQAEMTESMKTIMAGKPMYMITV